MLSNIAAHFKSKKSLGVEVSPSKPGARGRRRQVHPRPRSCCGSASPIADAVERPDLCVTTRALRRVGHGYPSDGPRRDLSFLGP